MFIYLYIHTGYSWKDIHHRTTFHVFSMSIYNIANGFGEKSEAGLEIEGGGEEQNCGGDVNLCCIKKRKKIQNLCHIRIKTFIKGCMKALVMLFAESRCGRFFDAPNASQDTSGWSTKCWQDNPVIQWHETPSVIHADPAVQCPPNFMGTWPQRVYSDLTAPFQSLDSEAEPMTKSW